ncbi:MAG: CoA-binding protein [Helicobacteraceae bacterium]|nr:CoA-binding protein [Helicobacteraceae bacterium]
MQETNKQKLKDILEESKNIAIIGLSPDSSKDSNMVGIYLKNNGYNIIPIYPKEEKILDSKVYRSLKDALSENKIDIVVMFRKGEVATILAKEIIDSSTKPKLLWLQLGIENNEAKAMMENYGVGFVQNKCIKIEHQLLFK